MQASPTRSLFLIFTSNLVQLTSTLALTAPLAQRLLQPSQSFSQLEALQVNLQVGKAAQTLQLLLDNSHHDQFDFAFVGEPLAPRSGQRCL